MTESVINRDMESAANTNNLPERAERVSAMLKSTSDSLSLLRPLLDNPVAFFRECDRLAEIPLRSDERARWAYLDGKARTVGLSGTDRQEYFLLDKRRNS